MSSASIALSPEELIAAAGYVNARAMYMKQVLSCAFETLRHAEQRLTHEWAAFCTKKGALRKSPAGAKKSAHGLKAVRPQENALTYELGSYVEEYMRALPVGHEYRDVVRFHYEKPLPSTKLAGSHQKRLDLMYYAQVPKGPELVLEAKPLFEPSDVLSRYLGEEGLGRFVRDEESYTQGEFGGLLGYVRNGTSQSWSVDIRAAVKSAHACAMVRDLNSSVWSGVYCSQHVRNAPRSPVWMLHLLITYPAS